MKNIFKITLLSAALISPSLAASPDQDKACELLRGRIKALSQTFSYYSSMRSRAVQQGSLDKAKQRKAEQLETLSELNSFTLIYSSLGCSKDKLATQILLMFPDKDSKK